MQPTIDNPFCASVRRETNASSIDFGTVRAVFAQPENVARFRAAGLGVTVNYVLAAGTLGRFAFNLVGGYRDRLSRIATPSADPVNMLGQQPRYTGVLDLTWARGPLTLNYGLVWQSRTNRFSHEEMASGDDLAPASLLHIKERWEHDIQASLDVASRFTLFGGVNNFTGQKPNVVLARVPVSPVGRTLYMGARINIH